VTGDADDELMRRLAAGDQGAFAALYERHRTRVFTFLLRLVRDRAAAEDLLQEVFLRVYRARAEYTGRTRFQAWLFTIARRLLVDHLRRAGPAPVEEADTPDAPAPETPAQHAEARELAARLERALEHLPPAQREVLLLARLGGLDAGEIAAVTGSTPGAVRVALHRALRRLRDLL
jgi:RNA polymerase sigma-70 factor (ECF subfamily)